MNTQPNQTQASLFQAAMADWRAAETIFCLQRWGETGPVVSVFDTAELRDNAGGQLEPEVWFDLDIPSGCAPERKAQLADQCSLTRAYLKYGKCRVVFRNAASIKASTQPGFRFSPGDVVLWTNGQGVTWHARRVVEQEMTESGPQYYLTPNDAPWASVRESNLRHERLSYDELLNILPGDGGLMRRVQKEPRYLERAAAVVASRQVQEG